MEWEATRLNLRTNRLIRTCLSKYFEIDSACLKAPAGSTLIPTDNAGMFDTFSADIDSIPFVGRLVGTESMISRVHDRPWSDKEPGSAGEKEEYPGNFFSRELVLPWSEKLKRRVSQAKDTISASNDC